MRVSAAGLVLLLLKVPLSPSCDGVDHVLICQSFPPYFSPGYLTLLMYLREVAEVNATVFRSENLTSVTTLRMDNAGVTAVAGGAFSSFLNLTSVFLEGNQLTQMDRSWFGRPGLLRELSLAQNQMEAVRESTLDGLVGLQKLHLCRNRIRTIEPNSFRSQLALAELDLSGNRMTRISPRVFGSLWSTRMRLDGNPWDCSCGAEDFVVFLKGLQTRSLLDRLMDVTCDSPPSLRGQPVWSMSTCETSPLPGQTGAPTVPVRPPDGLTTVPQSSSAPTAPSEQTVQTTTTSSHTVVETFAPPRSTEVVTTQAATDGTSAAFETETPPHLLNGSCATFRLDSYAVCMLIVVLVVVCVPPVVLCVLLLHHRRKTVMPGRLREEESQVEDDTRPGPEAAQIRSVRAKSADTVLLTSLFCVSVTEQHQPEDTQTDGGQEVKHKPEAGGGLQIENTTERRAAGSLDGNPECVSVRSDSEQYLSIGAKLSTANPGQLCKQLPDRPGQRSRMGRISTWPPTAAQWKARRQMMEEEEEEEEEEGKKEEEEKEEEGEEGKKEEEEEEGKKEEEEEEGKEEEGKKEEEEEEEEEEEGKKEEEEEEGKEEEEEEEEEEGEEGKKEEEEEEGKEEGEEGKKEEEKKVPGEVKINKQENPCVPAQTEDLTTKDVLRTNPAHADIRQPDPEPLGPSRVLRPAQRSRRSGPDGASLLGGNQSAFMDLLHEVVQNNGRWTRERWRQSHVHRQQR